MLGMNLYDKDDGFATFTIAEANGLLPKIIGVTEAAANALEKLKQEFEVNKAIDAESAQEHLDEETGEVLQNWSDQVVELGVYPKGYFTVDFKTEIPNMLLCWTYGEEEITHAHKIYETFKDRTPIKDEELLGFEESIN